MGKSSSKTSKSATLGNTTTTNPYVTSQTTNNGTTTKFNESGALNSVYNFVNKNINSLLDEYLTPNINSTTNQAKLNAFSKALNNETQRNLENNIINPLSNRNMIRSSQATDLYKNLSDSTNNAISTYINELLAESEANTANKLNTLLSAYMQGYNVVSDNQTQSLNTSSQNTSSSSSGNSSNNTMNNVMRVVGAIADLYSKK